MIKTVIFDYDGVVKKSQKFSLTVTDLYKISIEKYKKFVPKFKPIIENFDKGLITEEKFWTEFSKITGKTVPKECGKNAHRMYRENFVFFTEVIDLIGELKNQRFKFAVLSNMFPYQAKIVRENNEDNLFDNVFLSCERGLKKPDLEFYELVIKEMNINPKECLFIDDKEENLLPAEKLGIRTVLAKNPEQIIEDVWGVIKSENNT